MKGTLGSAAKPASMWVWLAQMRAQQKYLRAACGCRFCLFPGFHRKLHFGGYYVVLVDMRDLLELL
jgi:hypothetical protein